MDLQLGLWSPSHHQSPLPGCLLARYQSCEVVKYSTSGFSVWPTYVVLVCVKVQYLRRRLAVGDLGCAD